MLLKFKSDGLGHFCIDCDLKLIIHRLYPAWINDILNVRALLDSLRF